MSSKVIQFTLFPLDDNPEDSIKKMLKGLFARDTTRKKEIETLMMRNLELEEVVFRMNSRLDRISQQTSMNA